MTRNSDREWDGMEQSNVSAKCYGRQRRLGGIMPRVRDFNRMILGLKGAGNLYIV